MAGSPSVQGEFLYTSFFPAVGYFPLSTGSALPPCKVLTMFSSCSTLTGCRSPGLFAPLHWCTRLYISISCFHSFRQKHLLCTCRSRKSDVWIVFPQISRITHIHCHPLWAVLPEAAAGSDEIWGTPIDLRKSWNLFVPGQRLITSPLHAPEFVLPLMPHNTHWEPELPLSLPFTAV